VIHIDRKEVVELSRDKNQRSKRARPYWWKEKPSSESGNGEHLQIGIVSTLQGCSIQEANLTGF
jgi:hypothetical protein